MIRKTGVYWFLVWLEDREGSGGWLFLGEGGIFEICWDFYFFLGYGFELLGLGIWGLGERVRARDMFLLSRMSTDCDVFILGA